MLLGAIYCKIFVTHAHVGTSGNTSEDHFFSKADSESQSVSMLELTQKALPNIGISWIEIAKDENAKKYLATSPQNLLSILCTLS